LRLQAEEHDDAATRTSAVTRVVTWYLDNTIAADLVVMPLRRRLNSRYEDVRRRPTAFPDVGSALDWLERERPNLLAAQRRAADLGLWDTAWQLCEAMWGLFLYRKHFEHWIGAHELGIEAAGRAGNPAAAALLTIQLGIAYLNLDRYDTAYDRFATALELSLTAGDRRTEATAQEHLGLAARRTGRPELAIERFTAALAITERLGEHRGTAFHLRRIGETLSELGRDSDALPYLRNAVTVSTEVRDPVLRAQALTRLGATLTRVDELAGAEANLREAVGVLASASSDHYHADALVALSELDVRTGDRTAARQHLQLAYDLYSRAGMPRARQILTRLDALDGRTDTSTE
jgi:tetratricopeptide (TPR) repeat protein